MDLDAIDIQFVDSFLPEGAVATGLFGIVTWIDEDGEEHMEIYDQTSGSLANLIGLLEVAKLRVWHGPPEEDEE